MQILKDPQFENDDYLIRIDLDKIPTGFDALVVLKKLDQTLADYYETKREAFLKQDTNPVTFYKFVDERPSFRALTQLTTLDSTIYTVACERENRLSYFELLDKVKRHLALNPSTRRCMVRLANGFDAYYASEIESPSDVTCLNLIHYLESGPKLVFRASDIKNELLIDVLTIFEFFIKPVYSDYKNLQMSIYCSTAQGVLSWVDFIKQITDVCK